MSEFGDGLKQARVARGLSLHDIAGATKILIRRARSARARRPVTPAGRDFSRAFVRAYAGEVGLDPETTVTAFLAERARSEQAASEAIAVPEVTADDREFLERQRQAAVILRVVVFTLVVAAIVFAMWRFRVI